VRGYVDNPYEVQARAAGALADGGAGSPSDR
jgi:hypothetical protein